MMAMPWKINTPLSSALGALVLSSVVLVAGGAGNVDEIRRGDDLLQELNELPSIHFVAIGDWGAPPTHRRQRSGQQAVADGVASWLDEYKSNNGEAGDQNDPFILSLGDNFYPSGVRDADDMEERFSQSFDEVYSHDAFDNVPWYVIAGNKDYEGDISAQMNYTGTGSSRWIFPDYFHKVVREIPISGDNPSRNSIKVEIIAIDTMKLAGSLDNLVGEIAIDQRMLRETAEFRWIRHQLSQSDADYLIVAGHFPAHPQLDGLLQTYEVSAYVSGHIHCQQHRTKNGVDHFTSGAGMELDCKKDTIDHKGATGGFLSFDARVNKLVVRFHDQDGNEIHSTGINPRLMHENGMLE